MPKVSEYKEARLRRVIRDTLAIDPIISLRSLQDVVEKKINHSIDLEYLSKLIKKVNGEIAVRADTEKVDVKIAQLRESNRMIREALLKIAYPQPQMMVKHSDQLRALELIAKIEHTQAKLEMDFGLFTRHLGQLDVDHRLHPIEDNTRANIITAFRVWNVAPPVPRKIEPVAMKTKEKDKETNEPTTHPADPVLPQSNAIPAVTGGGLVVSE